MSNTYSIGRKAEQQVAQILRRAGASVKVSPGSRGAADLHADFGTKKWDVQVKAGKNASTQLTGIDKQRLNSIATKNNTTPVLATVKNGKVEFRSNRCGRKLSP